MEWWCSCPQDILSPYIDVMDVPILRFFLKDSLWVFIVSSVLVPMFSFKLENCRHLRRFSFVSIENFSI